MKNRILFIIAFSMTSIFSMLAQENQNNDVILKNLSELNSEFLEFSPIPYKDGLIFTSSRKAGGLLSCPPAESGKFSDLYYAKKGEEGEYEAPKILKGKVNGKHNDGVATVAGGGQKMYFSRNNMEGKNINEMIDRKIYGVDLVDENWANINEFPYNNDTFSTCHPAVTEDGMRMIFASNRPGGHGGMDLYSTIMKDGQWGPPVNLGPSINTDSNEIFPFLDFEGNLFFSSNKQGGHGGLDIWAAVADDDGEWGEVTNMGAPFNTSYDDLSFSSNGDGSEGFFASNREGGQGMDDLYSWEYAPDPIEAIIVVYDEDTGEELEKVPVLITPRRIGNSLDKIYGKAAVERKTTIETNPEGSLKYDVQRESEYAIHVEKEGYIPADRLVTTLEMTKDGEYRIPIKRDRVLVDLDGLVVDANTNAPLAMSEVTIIDETTGEEVKFTADGEGTFPVEIDCKHNYKIVARKEGYVSKSISLNDILTDCTTGKLPRPIIKLPPFIKIVLEGVYFDFDKATLRPEGKEALEEVVDYMKKYPSLEILLTAHTDCRGSNEYNMDLSERRAKSAVQYIVDQNIDEKRFQSKGFGESKLVNKCSDGVKCTDEEHQANRRVEVEVTKFEEEGVEIQN